MFAAFLRLTLFCELGNQQIVPLPPSFHYPHSHHLNLAYEIKSGPQCPWPYYPFYFFLRLVISTKSPPSSLLPFTIPVCTPVEKIRVVESVIDLVEDNIT